MGRIIRVERKGGSRFSVMVQAGSVQVEPGWRAMTGAVVGDDGCRVEDLRFKGLERDEAFETFAYLVPQPMTQGEAIETILDRCRAGGVTVVPGETVKNEDGQWTFRDWYLSR